jgi:Mg2+/Co2+ transporter CorB
MAEILIILALVCLSGFFSGSETALTALSRARIFHLVKEGHATARIVERLRDRKEALIGSILLGNNLVNIAAASIATTMAIDWFGLETGPLYATIFMTLLVLIFAEILPKTIAINHAEKVAFLVARPLTLCVKIFYPAVWLIQHLITLVCRLFGINTQEGRSFASAAEAIRGTIELHHQEGGMEKEDRDMLGSILDLADREVGEVMTHRKNVYAINMADEPDAIIEQAIDSVHSRIPLYKDSPDNIIAVLHVKDVLKLVRNQRIGITREMIRRIGTRPWFVPDSTSLNDQLLAFRAQRKHFALVVDEYGAFLGIVTLEDIIEEIVGEIDDEHDALQMDNIIPFGEQAWRVEGTVTIRDLNRHLDWDLPDEHAITVAGLVLHEAEMIPEQGAVFEFYGKRFTIAERINNQITQLILEAIDPDEDDA